MRLPIQANPILRNSTNIFLNNGAINPSGLSNTECAMQCNNLTEPARTICKQLCG